MTQGGNLILHHLLHAGMAYLTHLARSTGMSPDNGDILIDVLKLTEDQKCIPAQSDWRQVSVPLMQISAKTTRGGMASA